MSEISIKILSSEEFDNLPVSDTKGTDISESLGFCDVPNQKIFVRHTGIDELNAYTVNHEIEHLFSDDKGHDDPLVPGIRHKKFGKEILSPLFTGVNLETGKFSPAGIFDPSITKRTQQIKQTAQQPQLQRPQTPQFQPFGGVTSPALSPATIQAGGSSLPQGPPGSNVAGGLTTGLQQGGLSGISPGLQSKVQQLFAGSRAGRRPEEQARRLQF